jgi:CheY-like chemotaxis protein
MGSSGDQPSSNAQLVQAMASFGDSNGAAGGLNAIPLSADTSQQPKDGAGFAAAKFKSCDEALVNLAETEAGRRPDLIVGDYQLSRGLTGVDVIERLRIVRKNSSASHQCPAC